MIKTLSNHSRFFYCLCGVVVEVCDVLREYDKRFLQETFANLSVNNYSKTDFICCH